MNNENNEQNKQSENQRVNLQMIRIRSILQCRLRDLSTTVS